MVERLVNNELAIMRMEAVIILPFSGMKKTTNPCQDG
jgi:hypothetical protein